MSWKEWSAVLVVIGAGILLQVPRHDSMSTAGTHSDGMHAPEEPMGVGKTVVLEVTGMT
jgi:hypothetical protein